LFSNISVAVFFFVLFVSAFVVNKGEYIIRITPQAHTRHECLVLQHY